MADRALTILIAAVEPSADAIGASLMRALKGSGREIAFSGCGGPLMAREGLASLFPIEPFAVMGATDVLRVAPLAMKRARELARKAAEIRADIAVFVDGWAFSRLAATRLRLLSPETTSIKLVAPQVWASRPQRVKFVKRYFDGVLALLPFEPRYFAKEGVPATFVGNPNFQAAWKARGDGAAFRARHRLGEAPTLAILLGSRKTEVARLRKPFVETAKILAREIEGLRVVSPAAESVDRDARKALSDCPGDPVIVGAEEKYDAMAAANVALVASGTASTELAINRTPMIVAYRVDPLTAIWARLVMKSPYASIVNVAAGRSVIPEFIQEDCAPLPMAQALYALFKDPDAYVEQASAFDAILKELGVDGADAGEAAARQVLAWEGLGRKRAGVMAIGSRLPSSGPAS